MSQDKRAWFAQIFLAMMIFTGLVWVWTVAFIIAWPWEKSNQWKPEFRLAALCEKNEPCSVAYGKLAEARASGHVLSLQPAGSVGEVQDEDAWVAWKTVSGQPALLEVKASSWHFQTTIRYRVEGAANDTPVLVEYQDIAAKALYYGMAAGLFSLLGIYLRKLRK